MTEIIESNRLIELVIEKHKRLLDAFNMEFSGLNERHNSIKQQVETLKKEKETAESRIMVLNEKYHLFFHQAKKQREEIFNQAVDRMRGKPADLQEVMRMGSNIGELEKKLQTSINIDEEERIVTSLKKILSDFESVSGKAGIIVSCKGIEEKLDEAISSHKNLLSLNNAPKQYAEMASDFDKQINEIEGRHNWLKHRIESHNNALAYWEKQKGGINVG